MGQDLVGDGGRELAGLAELGREVGRAVAEQLGDERGAIARLCQDISSVAEISAHLGIPVGVVRVLVGDMVADGLVHLYRPGAPGDRPDLALLERVLLGLRAI